MFNLRLSLNLYLTVAHYIVLVQSQGKWWQGARNFSYGCSCFSVLMLEWNGSQFEEATDFVELHVRVRNGWRTVSKKKKCSASDYLDTVYLPQNHIKLSSVAVFPRLSPSRHYPCLELLRSPGITKFDF